MSCGINAATVQCKYSFIPLAIGALGVLFLTIMPMEALCPIIIFLFGLTFAIFFIAIFAPEDFNFLLRIYLAGFGIRVFLSFLFHIFSFISQHNYSPGFLFPNDGWSYSQQGWQIYKFVERGIKVTQGMFMADPNMKVWGCSGNITSYDFFTSFVYSITGYSPLSLFFINSLASSIAALFIYLIARELFSKNVARISCIFAFFWPSFIMWATQNFKEPVLTMFMGMLLFSLLYMYKYLAFGFLLFSFVSVLVFVKIGFLYLALISGSLFFVGLFLVAENIFKNKFVAMFATILILCIFLFIFRDMLFSVISEKGLYDIKSHKNIFTFLDYNRRLRAYGGLKFLQEADVSSMGKIVGFLPIGLIFAIFAPFPWQLGSFMQALAVPETLIFYVLFSSTVRGIVFGFRKRRTQTLFLISIIASILFFLALVEGNSGTLFRHRCMAFYLLFIFTATGLSFKK